MAKTTKTHSSSKNGRGVSKTKVRASKTVKAATSGHYQKSSKQASSVNGSPLPPHEWSVRSSSKTGVVAAKSKQSRVWSAPRSKADADAQIKTIIKESKGAFRALAKL